jgi:hypothetical protein
MMMQPWEWIGRFLHLFIEKDLRFKMYIKLFEKVQKAGKEEVR